jgi:hypothetical protein
MPFNQFSNPSAYFREAIVNLSKEVNLPAFMDAVMLPQTFQVTTKRESSNDVEQSATLIILRSILPVHASSRQVTSSHLIYSPLSLFLTQQSVRSRLSRETFAKEAHKEFISLFETTLSIPGQPRWRMFSRDSRVQRLSASWLFGNVMEEGIASRVGHEVAIDADTKPTELAQGSNEQLPGVVVQKSVSVTVRDKDVDEQSKTTLSDSSTQGESPTTSKLNDDAIWADICFKGIVKR